MKFSFSSKKPFKNTFIKQIKTRGWYIIHIIEWNAEWNRNWFITKAFKSL